MRTRNLLLLSLQRARARPLQELLALLGIAVGVALAYAVLVANGSVAASIDELVRGVAGRAELQLTARGPHGFEASVAREVARVPGVRATAPLVELRASIAGPAGRRTVQLIGGDERLAALGGTLTRELLSPHIRLADAVALPVPVAEAVGARGGDRVRISLRSRMREAPVATVLGEDRLGVLVDSPLALAPLRYVRRLSGMEGRLSRVLVDAEPGHERRVRAALERIAAGRLSVTDGEHEARLLRRAAAPNDQSTALFAAISALVGLLFAFNAMLLAVPERRRFIADLRLAGFGDLTVVRLVLFDALVLGMAACAVGLLLGDLLSRSAFRATPGYLSYAFAVGDQRIVSGAAILLAVAGGLGATLLAAMRPLGDLVSRRPLDAAHREEDEPVARTPGSRCWLLAGGLLLAVAATALPKLAPHATIAAVALLVGAMLLLVPGILAASLWALDLLGRRLRSRVLVVALGELRASATRALALAATGALAVFGSVAIEGSHFDLQRGLDADAKAFNARADLWITPTGAERELATVAFRPPAGTVRLAQLADVREVRAYRGAFLDVGDRRAWVVAPPREDSAPLLASQLIEGDLATATRRLRAGGWVGLSRAVAASQGAAVGDLVTLPTPRPLRLRLAAVLTNLGWSSGAVVLNAEDFRRGWGSADVSALQVILRPGAAPATAATAVRSVLGPGAGLTVETAGQREQRFRTSTRQGLARLTQIAQLVIVAAALALAVALGGVLWSRRPRLAALKLSGFGDGEVWRALTLESAVVLGVGCSVGAAFGLYGQYMLTHWLTDATGFPTAYAPAGTLALATVLGVTLVAVAIAAVPGLLAARVSPAASLADD